MSNKRYLEFDSTYRDRNCYPCPADFTVKVTCAKDSGNGLTANDYVANEYPEDSWYQVPYAGSTSNDLVNKKYVLNPNPDVNLGATGGQIDPDDPSTIPTFYPDLTTDIPIVINGKSYASMWPIDWMNGASPTYFSNLVPPDTATGVGIAAGPVRIGSGAASVTDYYSVVSPQRGSIISFGTRFDGHICSGALTDTFYTPNITMTLPPFNAAEGAANALNAQFWMSAAVRNRNILAPEKFSGGTASAPQLGPKSIEQGKFDNYFTGAMLFRFTKNPLYDTNTALGGSTGTADGTTGNGPLLGSLGFPYYYQKLSFAVPPPAPVTVGQQISGINTAGGGAIVFAYVACVISQQEIIVRLGGEIPIDQPIFGGAAVPNTETGARMPIIATNSSPINVFPGVPPNLEPIAWDNGKPIEFDTTQMIKVVLTPLPLDWAIPTSGSRPFPAYFWCGFVESAIIQSYDSNSGLVTLDQPFLSSGSNSFNTASDYYLIDFDSDPTGHWNKTSQPYANINSGSPRTFFPGGAAIPNYYSGRAITSISRELIQTNNFGLQDTKIKNYDVNRRVLYLEDSLEPDDPGYRGVEISSQYTLVFLNEGLALEEELPIGSFIAWNGSGANGSGGNNNSPSSGTNAIPSSVISVAVPPVPLSPQTGDMPGVYYVAVTAPKGATCIVLQGARNPQTPCVSTTCVRNTPLLNMLGNIANGVPTSTDQPNINFGSVQVPPYWNKTVVDHWRTPGTLLTPTQFWSTLTPSEYSPLGLGSLLGAQTILVRGKSTVPLKNNFIPYSPMSSISVANDSPIMIKNNGVVSLQVLNGGLGYKITDPSKPIMALISLPTDPDPWTYNPVSPPIPVTNFDPFPGKFVGMKPRPERFQDNAGNYVYTFANICFVNVTSVGSGGKVLEVSVNCPGEGYPRGSQVFLLDGFSAGTDTGTRVPTSVDTYDAQNNTPTNPKWIPGPGSRCTCVISDTAQFLGLAGHTFPGIPRPGDMVYLPSYGWGRRGEPSRTIYNSAPEIGEFVLNFSGTTADAYYLETPTLPPTVQNCLADEQTFPETGTRVITASIRSRNSQILIRPFVYNWDGPSNSPYHTVQYASPGAYFGGFFGLKSTTDPNGRPQVEGKNDVLWLALDKNIDVTNCLERYAFSSDSYVNGNYSFCGLTNAWTYDNSNPIGSVGNLTQYPFIPQGIPDAARGIGQWSDARFLSMGQGQIPNLHLQGSLQLSNSLGGNWLQLLTFNRDNEYPLNYTGSTVSQNQMVCYEIELISLILPNLPLDNTIGGLIAFYPYLYVELSNATAPSGGTPGIIYSNNPNARRALFRVAIDDTPTPVISKFIKVDGDGAVQTVKFKPNDNLRLHVYLQNGTLFETQTKDTTPPSFPDPFVQISAEFSIRRLT
jgi:hypothetical protein